MIIVIHDNENLKIGLGETKCVSMTENIVMLKLKHNSKVRY